MLISDGNFEAVVAGRKPQSADEWWVVRWHENKPLQRETMKGLAGWSQVSLTRSDLIRRLKDYLSHPAGISLNAGTAIDRVLRSL